jgi:hypothetical protein
LYLNDLPPELGRCLLGIHRLDDFCCTTQCSEFASLLYKDKLALIVRTSSTTAAVDVLGSIEKRDIDLDTE